MPDKDSHRYFFDHGIRFECVHCGTCCTGSPGRVRVSDAEIDVIAHHRQLTREVFTERYVRQSDEGFVLREESDGRCVFFDDRCTIHPVRPSQCRTYPFWYKNMRSTERWEQTCRACPGIGQGRLYSREDILQALHESMPAKLSEADF